MTGGAAGFVLEEMLATLCGSFVEAAGRRLGHTQSQLIVEQGRKLWRDEIRRLRDREADSRIAEPAVTAHLSNADIAIPIRDRSVRGEALEPDAFQPEDRRDDNRARWAVQ